MVRDRSNLRTGSLISSVNSFCSTSDPTPSIQSCSFGRPASPRQSRSGRPSVILSHFSLLHTMVLEVTADKDVKLEVTLCELELREKGEGGLPRGLTGGRIVVSVSELWNLGRSGGVPLK